MTIIDSPEVTPTQSGAMYVKVKLADENWKKVGDQWEQQDPSEYQVDCFGDVANQILMMGAGEIIDWEGKVKKKSYMNKKYNKKMVSTSFIMDSFKLYEDTK